MKMSVGAALGPLGSLPACCLPGPFGVKESANHLLLQTETDGGFESEQLAVNH